jgi:hypothetical protein
VDPHTLFDASLQIWKPCGVGERDHLALTATLRLRLAYLVLSALPSAGVAQQVVDEALEAGGDGVGAGADVGCGKRLETALLWFALITTLQSLK